MRCLAAGDIKAVFTITNNITFPNQLLHITQLVQEAQVGLMVIKKLEISLSNQDLLKLCSVSKVTNDKFEISDWSLVLVL